MDVVSVDALAGVAAGLAGQIVEYPFDTVKTRMQSPYSTTTTTTNVRSAANATVNATIGSALKTNVECEGETLLQCLRGILQEEGVHGFYRGFGVPLVGSMLEYCVNFAVYATVRTRVERQYANGSTDVPMLMNVGCGGVSGFAVSFVLTPVELLKVRMQQPCARHLSVLGMIREVTDGYTQWTRLYKGHVATLAREVPGNMAWFGCYEYVCSLMRPVGGTKDDLSVSQVAFAGGVAGTMYWTAFFPADVAKTHIQLQTSGAEQISLPQCLTYLYKKGGVRALYRGYSVCALRAGPVSACVFATFETISRKLNGVVKDTTNNKHQKA